MTDQQQIVTIFGSSAPKPADADYQLAEQLGYALAQSGWTICNGGYGGTMRAAACGARRAGGGTIGVTCSLFGPGKANEYIDREITTDSLSDRLEKLIDLGRAYVVLPGGTGTLVELSMVWELQNKKLLPARPIVVVGNYWLPVLEVCGRDQPESRDVISVADGLEDVCRLLSKWLNNNDRIKSD